MTTISTPIDAEVKFVDEASAIDKALAKMDQFLTDECVGREICSTNKVADFVLDLRNYLVGISTPTLGMPETN